MCTCVNDRATISKAVLLGARRYILKPCNNTSVAETLRQVGPASSQPG